MKKIIYIICFIFLLTGCSYVKEESDTNLQFNKKKECASYKEEMYKEIPLAQRIGEFPAIIKEIFYSPKRNSCIYVYANESGLKAKIAEKDFYYIIDYFTKETIYSSFEYDVCKEMLYLEKCDNLEGENLDNCKIKTDISTCKHPTTLVDELKQ